MTTDTLIEEIKQEGTYGREGTMIPTELAISIIKKHQASEIGLKPTPDNPCGHQLGIHEVCKRCGMLGAAEYLDKRQQREISVVDRQFLDWITLAPLTLGALRSIREEAEKRKSSAPKRESGDELRNEYIRGFQDSKHNLVNLAAEAQADDVARTMYEDAYVRQPERPYEAWAQASDYAKAEWIAVARAAIAYIRSTRRDSNCIEVQD